MDGGPNVSQSPLLDVPRVTNNINYEEFVDNFLSKNIPCLLSEIHTRSWKSRQEWTCKGKPAFDFLEKSFGDAVVPVADCNKIEYQSHPKHTMPLKDFLNYWKSSCNHDNSNQNEPVCWYMKDWHFCKSFPDYKAYTTPSYFQSDWLNEFWDKWSDTQDDYRFVYMGPKGSWTPFHADVFRSYSWSANICGRKKWILYPPGSEEYLKDRYGNLVFDLRSQKVNDRHKFPNFHQAPKPLVVHQKEGEIIFVPSCWYHQVINEEDTISINHNWTNGSGIARCWNHLKQELQLVKQSIDDCRSMENWNQQCQIILKANSGINFEGFFQLLCSISGSRVAVLRMLLPDKLTSQLDQSPPCLQDQRHGDNSVNGAGKAVLIAKECKFDSVDLCSFDLQKVGEVLEDFKGNGDLDSELKDQTVSLSVYISKILDNCSTRM